MSHPTPQRLTTLLIFLLLSSLLACTVPGAAPAQENITVYTALEDDLLPGYMAVFEKE
ncbi:MAG: hypothetical protein H0T73_07310, partial [Ardenticatenales bacterium]|nr:hypothetical protein [Ardenticatenales bacterium]